eukprot:COSAG03_NODE_19500_length_335_cov_0.923729_1_plen_41_part_10
MYLALPAHQHVVDERDCPPLRWKTQHFIRDGRRRVCPEEPG